MMSRRTTWGRMAAGGALLAGVSVLGIAGCAPPPDDSTVQVAGSTSRPAPSAPPIVATSAPIGDQAPHEVENNAWKERKPISRADAAQAKRDSRRIKAALLTLQARGDFTLAATRDALEDLGFRWQVAEYSSPVNDDPGIYFGAYVGTTACVIGSLTPDKVSVGVDGVATEFGCLQPFTH